MADVLLYLIVAALAGTLAVLAVGIFSMFRGGDFNRRWGNKLMRARVAFQFLAIALLVLLFLFTRGD